MSANPDAFPPPLSPARKAWRFLRALARPALARKVGTLVTEGYLQRTGWVRSVEEDAVVDAGGEPRPWATRNERTVPFSRLAKWKRGSDEGRAKSATPTMSRRQTALPARATSRWAISSTRRS